MEKQEANVITFRLSLILLDVEEDVYISDEAYDSLPLTSDLRHPNTEAIIPDYFTKEKIEELKKRVCKQIMNSDNPFYIFQVDTDYLPVEKDKIWK